MFFSYPDVRWLAAAIGGRIHEVIPEGICVGLSHLIDITVIPSLPRMPWPPSYPEEWEDWASPDEAARFLFAISSITVAPHDDPDVRTETVRFAECAETQRTAIWLPRARFDELRTDLDRLVRIVDLSAKDIVGRPLDAFVRGPLLDVAGRHDPSGDFERAVAAVDYSSGAYK